MSDRDEVAVCLSRAANSEAAAMRIDEKVFAMENEARQYRALAARLRARALLIGGSALTPHQGTSPSNGESKR